MNNYINKIMSNHVFNSDSSEDLYYLYSDDNVSEIDQRGGSCGKQFFSTLLGGEQPDSAIAERSSDERSSDERSSDERSSGDTDKPEDRPNGGFPPIIIMDAKEKEIEQSKNRQLTAKKVGVSIKDILSSKK